MADHDDESEAEKEWLDNTGAMAPDHCDTTGYDGCRRWYAGCFSRGDRAWGRMEAGSCDSDGTDDEGAAVHRRCVDRVVLMHVCRLEESPPYEKDEEEPYTSHRSPFP